MSQEIHFALHKERLLWDEWPGAIVEATLNRAAGLAHYLDVVLWLVECDDRLFEYAVKKLSGHNVRVERTTLRELPLRIPAGSWVVTHDWPSKIPPLMGTLGDARWLLTLDVVPLFDRSRSLTDRILSAHLVRKVLTRSWRGHLRRAKKLVAVSDREKCVLEYMYGIQPHATIPYPIMVERSNHPKDGGVFLIDVGPEEAAALRRIIEALKPKRIVANVRTDGSVLSLIGAHNVERLQDNLPHQQFTDLMASADLVVIGEGKGMFEMPPLEAVASGTPAVSPMVPSLEMFQRYAEGAGIDRMPFLDIDRVGSLDEAGLHRWFQGALESLDDSRRLIERHFSMDSVGRQLYNLILLRDNLL
jgi:glycosyltransferase involved in cell wall biosynthesis